MLIAPLYGTRKAANQHKWFLRDVHSLAIQAPALALEAACLLHWARGQFAGPLAVTGISYGGAMAALASKMYARDVAVVPYMGCNGPGWTFVYGAARLRNGTAPRHISVCRPGQLHLLPSRWTCDGAPCKGDAHCTRDERRSLLQASYDSRWRGACCGRAARRPCPRRTGPPRTATPLRSGAGATSITSRTCRTGCQSSCQWAHVWYTACRCAWPLVGLRPAPWSWIIYIKYYIRHKRSRAAGGCLTVAPCKVRQRSGHLAQQLARG